MDNASKAQDWIINNLNLEEMDELSTDITNKMRPPRKSSYKPERVESPFAGDSDVFDLLSEGGQKIDLFSDVEAGRMGPGFSKHDPLERNLDTDLRGGFGAHSGVTEKLKALDEFITMPEFRNLSPMQQEKIFKSQGELLRMSKIPVQLAKHGLLDEFGADVSAEDQEAILEGHERTRLFQETPNPEGAIFDIVKAIGEGDHDVDKAEYKEVMDLPPEEILKRLGDTRHGSVTRGPNVYVGNPTDDRMRGGGRELFDDETNSFINALLQGVPGL